MDAGSLREKLIAELEQAKRVLGAEARHDRRRLVQAAIDRNDFQFDRGEHDVVFAERSRHAMRSC